MTKILFDIAELPLPAFLSRPKRQKKIVLWWKEIYSKVQEREENITYLKKKFKSWIFGKSQSK